MACYALCLLVEFEDVLGSQFEAERDQTSAPIHSIASIGSSALHTEGTANVEARCHSRVFNRYCSERDNPALRLPKPSVPWVGMDAHEILLSVAALCVVTLGVFGWNFGRTDSVRWALAKSASTLALLALVSGFVTAWAMTSDSAPRPTKSAHHRHAMK